MLAMATLAAGAASRTAAAQGSADDPVRRGRALVFPRDHGAHLGARTEWWYATGWLGPAEAPTHGVQVTFFRSRTGLAGQAPGRFAARHLLFAHAAVTDLAARRHVHADRIARWSGDPSDPLAAAATADADIRLGDWHLRRDGDTWRAEVRSRELSLRLELRRTQPLLLQGDDGFSRKGPDERQASHYYSEPQLIARAWLDRDAATAAAAGRAWLDHEWSEEILHPDARGWDWVGFNLLDGSALTAFQLRRADGSPVWAGGSWRSPGGTVGAFAPSAVRLQPGRVWSSALTGARYPVEWALQTPAGRFGVRALLDAQELDSRRSTGTIYWEGLSELLDDGGRRVGLGYLEMTGYAGPLRIG
jgi:predicted secreted hydrolase